MRPPREPVLAPPGRHGAFSPGLRGQLLPPGPAEPRCQSHPSALAAAERQWGHEEGLFRWGGGTHKVCWAAIALRNGEFEASEAGREKSFHAEFRRPSSSFFSLWWDALSDGSGPKLPPLHLVTRILPPGNFSSPGGYLGIFVLHPEVIFFNLFCPSQQAAAKCQGPKLPQPKTLGRGQAAPPSPSAASSQAATFPGNNSIIFPPFPPLFFFFFPQGK